MSYFHLGEDAALPREEIIRLATKAASETSALEMRVRALLPLKVVKTPNGTSVQLGANSIFITDGNPVDVKQLAINLVR